MVGAYVEARSFNLRPRCASSVQVPKADMRVGLVLQKGEGSHSAVHLPTVQTVSPRRASILDIVRRVFENSWAMACRSSSCQGAGGLSTEARSGVMGTVGILVVC